MGLIECILIGWLYGADKIREYANERSEIKLGKWYDICIKWLTPAILSIIVITALVQELQGAYGGYPTWALVLGGWLVVLAIPAVAYWLGRKRPATKEVLS